MKRRHSIDEQTEHGPVAENGWCRYYLENFEKLVLKLVLKVNREDQLDEQSDNEVRTKRKSYLVGIDYE